MPAGNIIGRVSVKVLPDTSEFRGRLQKELSAIEKSLKDMKVKVEVDLTHLLNSLDDARDILYKWRAAINKDMRLKIQIDKTNFDSDLVTVGKKLDDFQDDHDPLNINVDLDLSTALASGRLAWLTRPRTVDIIAKLDQSSVASVLTALSALSGARVLSDMFQNIWDGLKNLDRMVPKIGAISMAVGGIASWALAAVSNISALTLSLGQMVTAGLAAPGLFAGLGIALGVLITALTQMKKAAPELLESFKGLAEVIGKNFWEEAAAGVGQLLNVSLKPLAATARELGRLFGVISAEIAGPLSSAVPKMFGDLNRSLAMLADNGKTFASIITSLGEAGSAYLPRLAAWINSAADSFKAFLDRSSADGSLKAFIESGIQGFKDLGRVIKDVVLIIGDIGKAAQAAGGSTLGILADTLDRIRQITSSPTFQGGLTSVFQTAHNIMGAIADKVGPSLVKLFGTLADTFVKIGPAISDGIGTAVSAIADALSDPLLQKGIQDVFYALADAIKTLAPILGPVASAFASLTPIITALLDVIAPLVVAALEPLTEVIQTLAPAVVPLIQVLGEGLLSAVEALSPLLVTISQVFADMLPSITPLIDALINMVVQGAQPLIDAMVELYPTLLPLAQELFPVLLDAIIQLTPSLVELTTAWAEWVTTITPIATEILTRLIPALTWLVQVAIDTVAGIMSGFSNLFDGIKSIFDGFVSMFTGGWSGFWDGIKQIAKGVWELIVGVVEVALNLGLIAAVKKGLTLLKGLWEAGWDGIKLAGVLIWDSISAAWDAFLAAIKAAPMMPLNAIKTLFKTVWSDIKAVVSESWVVIKDTISDGLAAAKGFVEKGWAAVKSATKDAWVLVNEAIDTGIAEALAALRALPGKCVSAVGDLGGLLVGAGRALIQGFINGITPMIERVKGILSGLTSKLPDWKGPADKDRVLLYDAGRLVIGGFIRGLESQYDAVHRSLAGLSNDVGSFQMAAPSAGNLSAFDGAFAASGGAGSTWQKVLNYYAAPGSSMGSEEDLFTAAGRARMVGW